MPDYIPLAERLRPSNLDEFVGQEKLVGKNGPLRKAIESKQKINFILWGPPGVGKTTLARIYANALGLNITELSAVSSGKEDMRKAVEQGGMLFVDEIHRFNKAQQDFLLPFVESGQIILVGATTENPSFEVISPLLSRSRIFVLERIDESDMEKIFDRLGIEGIKVGKTERDLLINSCNGDIRQLIGTVEVASKLYGKLTVESIKKSFSSHISYDKNGEEHYNTISAFIKSMRSSDVDASVYYLARMIEAGEDPKFIARRMVIFASEDIGMAQPTALVVANEVFRSVEIIGYPECAINLAHGAIYLAKSPKDRRVYNAINSALEDVRSLKNLPIPLAIRNGVTKLMKKQGYGKDYKMYNNDSLLPEKIKGKKYFDL